ncbi:MAG: hypothetical protein WC788_08940 [Candidatus Paceibacterota bacterium]|jgi:hypothetical protein
MIIVDLAVQYWLLWLILTIASLVATFYCQVKFITKGVAKLDIIEALRRIWPVILFGFISFISGAMFLIAIAVGILRAA